MPRTRPRDRGTDGRANNGGVRQGTPGTPYANRSDLRQAPTAATGQPYGQAGAQVAAQRAVPLPAAPPPPAAAPGPVGAAGQGAAAAPPGPPPDLYRASERPGEHVMTGLPVGPGAGPEALPLQTSAMGDPTAIQIRAMLRANPTNQELANLVADLSRPQ